MFPDHRMEFVEGEVGEYIWEYRNKDGSRDMRVNGNRVTVNTKAENDWLTAIFHNPYGDSWHGANDIATRFTWVWDNGTTSGDNGLTDDLCGSTGCPNSDATWADNITRKWVSGEPNHSGASCGQIWKTSGPNWDDTLCNNNKYAIIEFD